MKDISVTGILESALYVRDLTASLAFYRQLFGFEVLFGDDRLQALSVAGRQVLLLFRQGASLKETPLPGGFIPPHDGQGPVHLAFSIPQNELEDWVARLALLDIPLLSRVTFNDGESLYFRDPDDHLLELATPGIWKGLR